MSKAFTRESDETRGDEIAPPRTQMPAGVKRYITRQGAERLRRQATELLGEKRALSSGGSAGSTDATTRVRRIDAAIQRIQQALDSVIIAEPPVDHGKIGFGASVQIRNQIGEEKTYQIVGPHEAEPDQGRISSNSPLAQALMNRRVGDSVRLKSPAGEQELTILRVNY